MPIYIQYMTTYMRDLRSIQAIRLVAVRGVVRRRVMTIKYYVILANLWQERRGSFMEREKSAIIMTLREYTVLKFIIFV